MDFILLCHGYILESGCTAIKLYCQSANIDSNKINTLQAMIEDVNTEQRFSNEDQFNLKPAQKYADHQFMQIQN